MHLCVLVCVQMCSVNVLLHMQANLNLGYHSQEYHLSFCCGCETGSLTLTQNIPICVDGWLVNPKDPPESNSIAL